MKQQLLQFLETQAANTAYPISYKVEKRANQWSIYIDTLKGREDDLFMVADEDGDEFPCILSSNIRLVIATDTKKYTVKMGVTVNPDVGFARIDLSDSLWSKNIYMEGKIDKILKEHNYQKTDRKLSH